MRTLTVHTADELATRWKRRAFDLNNESRNARTTTEKARLLDVAQAYRCCAAELDAITAVSMELEAAHHGDPEPEVITVSDDEGLLIRCDPSTAANALMEWSQGERP